jgi:predicted  nucleic acid-binding Zn-ribbon protein
MQTAESENDAQASARSEVISPEELPPKPDQSGWEQTTPGPQTEPDSEPTAAEQTDRPDLSELRAELNQQFESIKVLEPGQYELNLMELYDREEYIIALQEDGKYTVQVPEHWQD